MAGDSSRIEPHVSLTGHGLGSSPERIAELERQRKQAEKLSRPAPQQSFASVLAAQKQAKPISKKEENFTKRPLKGPKPGYVHPAQQEQYGRNDDEHDTIVLKA